MFKNKKLLTLLGLGLGVAVGLTSSYWKPYVEKYLPSNFNLEKALKVKDMNGVMDLAKDTFLPKQNQNHNKQQNSQHYSKKETQHNTNNEQQYIPKGMSAKFCGNNVYQGKQPIVSEGFKTSKNVKGIDKNALDMLCYNSFTAMYKNDYNISLYVAEKLSVEREKKSKNGGREATFYPDPNVLKKYGTAIKTEDYTGSGFDRGHLGASRNMPLDDRYESFYMTNIVPQTPENNRNIWADIEKETRCFTTKYQSDVYIVTIPVIDIKKHKAKGSLPFLKTRTGKEIVIPDYMAKAVYIPSQGVAGVYLTKNDKSKTHFSTISIKELEELSYIQPFPFLTESQKTKNGLPNKLVCQK